MQTKYLIAGLLFFAVAAGDILLLRRRNEAKIRTGSLTSVAAEKQLSYQWRLFTTAALIWMIWAGGVWVNQH